MSALGGTRWSEITGKASTFVVILPWAITVSVLVAGVVYVAIVHWMISAFIAGIAFMWACTTRAENYARERSAHDDAPAPDQGARER